MVLLEIGPGDHFGEMALIRAAPRSATATAVEPSELIAIRRTDFFEILRKEHELAVKLLWQFLGVLADRLDQTSRDLSSARQELAAEDISDAIFSEPEESALELALRDPGSSLLGLRSRGKSVSSPPRSAAQVGGPSSAPDPVGKPSHVESSAPLEPETAAAPDAGSVLASPVQDAPEQPPGS
jgi:Cyclic nucleotide-binding domain